LTNFNTTDSGTAESGTSDTLTDDNKTWTASQWVNGKITITSGTGAGQSKTVTANTGQTITVDSNWTTNPDSTSVYSLAQAPPWTSGKYGSALQFDGKNDYVDAGNGASLNITDAITVEAWVKENVRVASSKIASRRSVNSFYFLGSNNGKPYGGIGDGTSYTTIDKATEMPIGEWHHLAFTFIDAQNRGWLYYDGQLTKEGTITQSIGDLSGIKLSIGADIQGTNYYFNGAIDEVRIYNYARSADEIRLDYQAGLATHFGPSGKTCSEDPASCMDYGLAGYWDMDEGKGGIANDKSGNGNTGKLGNGVASAQPKWTQGKSSGALQFDGKNDYVDCGNGASLNITDAITIEAWVNRKSTQIDHARIVDKIGTEAYSLLFYTDDSEIKLYANIGGVYPIVPLNIHIQANQWEYIAVTYESSNHTVKGYQNGILKRADDTSVSGQIGINTANLYIGHRNIYPFNGLIDEVRIYNRALSAEEVLQHYRGIFVNETGLVGCWHMNEGSGDVVGDSSGEGNNGTRYGATWEYIGDPLWRLFNIRVDYLRIFAERIVVFSNVIKRAQKHLLRTLPLALIWQ